MGSMSTYRIETKSDENPLESMMNRTRGGNAAPAYEVAAKAATKAAAAGQNQTQRGLGRGLSALIGETKNSFIQTDDSQQMVATHKLRPTRFQPRVEFRPEPLQELANSISKNGIIQPLTVRPTGVKGEYEIVAGERRWRAAKLINLPTVPVIIKELEDKDVMELALVENIQREDLSPLEEAQAYRRLLGEFGYTQDDLARTVGKSRSHIANLLRLLSLPEPVKVMIKNGEISMGHARALLGCSDPVILAKRIITDGLSVRQIEDLAAKDIKKVQAKAERKTTPKVLSAKTTTRRNRDEDIAAIEELLTRSLGSTVEITSQGKKGSITIEYKSLEQLDNLIQRLSSHQEALEEELA